MIMAFSEIILNLAFCNMRVPWNNPETNQLAPENALFSVTFVLKGG